MSIVAGACRGSDDGDDAATSARPEKTTAIEGSAPPAPPAGSCDSFPLTLVQGKLGLTGIKGPISEVKGGARLCEYNNTDTSPAATIQINSAATEASFAKTRNGFTKNGAPVTPVAGLGDEAYSATFTYRITSRTLVVRRGATEVLITSTASADAIRALMDSVLAAI